MTQKIEGRARFRDGPGDVVGEVLVGVFPPGGVYRMEQDADGGVRLFRREAHAVRDEAYKQRPTPAQINEANRKFWGQKR